MKLHTWEYFSGIILLFLEEGTSVRLAVETLEELDWCLERVRHGGQQVQANAQQGALRLF